MYNGDTSPSQVESTLKNNNLKLLSFRFSSTKENLSIKSPIIFLLCFGIIEICADTSVYGIEHVFYGQNDLYSGKLTKIVIV